MADTDTAGAVEFEAQAGASGAEGFGMDASDDATVFESTAALWSWVLMAWSPAAPVRRQQGEVATRARTMVTHARVSRVMQRSVAAAEKALLWLTRVQARRPVAVWRRSHTVVVRVALHTQTWPMTEHGTVMDGNAGARATAVAGIRCGRRGSGGC